MIDNCTVFRVVQQARMLGVGRSLLLRRSGGRRAGQEIERSGGVWGKQRLQGALASWSTGNQVLNPSCNLLARQLFSSGTSALGNQKGAEVGELGGEAGDPVLEVEAVVGRLLETQLGRPVSSLTSERLAHRLVSLYSGLEQGHRARCC